MNHLGEYCEKYRETANVDSRKVSQINHSSAWKSGPVSMCHFWMASKLARDGNTSMPNCMIDMEEQATDSASGETCSKTPHRALQKALTRRSYWARLIKLGDGSDDAHGKACYNGTLSDDGTDRALAQTSAKAHNRALGEVLTRKPDLAIPIKLGGGANDTFGPASSLTTPNEELCRLDEGIWTTFEGAGLTFVQGHIWPTHHSCAARRRLVSGGVRENAPQASRRGPVGLVHHLDQGIWTEIEWDTHTFVMGHIWPSHWDCATLRGLIHHGVLENAPSPSQRGSVGLATYGHMIQVGGEDADSFLVTCAKTHHRPLGEVL
ncbi:hypothetical protein B0H10DRAFT_2193608 [Mycena sp. CBHHK59/15]|nr:hypothetical protein B0H10DRAFT_2193608 [Mycena sp. CBHHK59/15]